MAMDRWIEVDGNQAYLVEENDGPAFLRKGPERTMEAITILQVKPDRTWWGVKCQTADGREYWLSVPAADGKALERLVEPGAGVEPAT